MSKTLRILMRLAYFQPFSAGSTGSVNYAPARSSALKIAEFYYRNRRFRSRPGF